jgi:hypothetical protein
MLSLSLNERRKFSLWPAPLVKILFRILLPYSRSSFKQSKVPSERNPQDSYKAMEELSLPFHPLNGRGERFGISL